MSSYQTFPGQPGASSSAAKLASLALPPLSCKSFLDIGCNEGYFCGYAFFEGATKIIGIDKDSDALARAKQRFPQCSFLDGDWESLANMLGHQASFDVILCSSAIHYAKDQPALVKELVERLNENGVLVLEIGVLNEAQAASPESEQIKDGWHLIRRSIDARLFPTMRGVMMMLAPYAYKSMGKSVPQIGDPVERHVFHISRRRPSAILLLGNPGSGKTTLAALLGGKAILLRGDDIIANILTHRELYPKLTEAAGEYDCIRLDRAIFRILEAGLCAELAAVIGQKAAGRDFIYDGFVPEPYRDLFELTLARHGYKTAVVKTADPVLSPYEISSLSRQEARKYELFLSAVHSANKMRGIRAV